MQKSRKRAKRDDRELLTQLSTAEQRLAEKLAALEDSTQDIKVALTELKAMRAEIQS